MRARTGGDRLEGRLRLGAPPARPKGAGGRRGRGGEPLVVLAAAKVGTTRLIDNLEI